MTYWAEQYLGLPWESGAQGPDSYNCWGLVRKVAMTHFGYEPPMIAIDESQGLQVRKAFRKHPEHSRYYVVDVPKAGDIVEMGTRKDMWHVGIWLDVDGGGILHCVEGVGVVFTQPRHIRLLGWTQMLYWRFLKEVEHAG